MGRRRLLWIVWLAAAVILWFFENGPGTLAILLASLLLPLSSILWAKRQSARLRGGIAVSQKEGSFCVSVRPVGFWFQTVGSVKTENRLTGEAAEGAYPFPIRRSGDSTLSLRADTAFCGTLRIAAQIRTEDCFGLWRSPPVFCEPEFLTLTPALFPVEVSLSSPPAEGAESSLYSRTRPGNDPGEFLGVREYVPGDPIRQIHWKLSQKTGKPMLRELGLSVAGRTLLVFCNARRGRAPAQPEVADALAVAFLSLSHSMVGDGLAHTVAFAEDSHFILYDILTEADFLEMEARFLGLTWAEDDEMLLRLLAESSFGHTAIVAPSSPGSLEAYAGRSRITLILPDPADTDADLQILPITPHGFREEFRHVEL